MDAFDEIKAFDIFPYLYGRIFDVFIDGKFFGQHLNEFTGFEEFDFLTV
jgi:hypothetical protein